jgi:hypothetical protein
MTDIKVEYDSRFDILYLLVGEPTAAFSDCVAHDVYVRRDMVTERIAGVVIEGYSKKNKNCLSKILPMNLGELLPEVKM